MSLKAKLEAVVYAAEEPVTLAQLAVIFADEVLPLLDQAAEPPAEPDAEQIALTGLAPEENEQAATPEPPASEPPTVASGDAPASEEPSVAAEAEEGDEKKTARLRDRRIRLFLQQVLNELIADYANSERGM
jgi:segregation and condensation protein B